MHAEGEAYRRRHGITSFPVYTRGIYSDLPPETPVKDVNDEKPVSLQSILSNNKDTNKVSFSSIFSWILVSYSVFC